MNDYDTTAIFTSKAEATKEANSINKTPYKLYSCNSYNLNNQ